MSNAQNTFVICLDSGTAFTYVSPFQAEIKLPNSSFSHAAYCDDSRGTDDASSASVIIE